MTAPTQTVLSVQTATLENSIPLTDLAANVGLNATMHTVISGDVSADMIFPNTGNEIVIVRNTGAMATITVYSNACDQGFHTEHNNISTIATGSGTPTYKILGTFVPYRWNASYGTEADTVTNHARINVDTATTTQIMVLKVLPSGY